MSAYKQLKGIAAGLAGTFISRNNDVDGYWGMGVIYSEVSARGVSAVTFSLLVMIVVLASTSQMRHALVDANPV